MKYSELRHNNQESSRDSSEALLSAKTFNKHPPLFAENLIIANTVFIRLTALGAY